MSSLNYSSSDNTINFTAIYIAFRNNGPSMALIFPAAIINFIAIFGLISNLFVIFTTIKTKSLRGTANFLMALICLFEMMHESGHLVFLAIVVSGINFISRLTATFIALPMIFGINANTLAVFCVAFDRLFAVSFTKMHDSLNFLHKKAYLCVHVLICIIYSAYCCWLILTFASHHSDDPTTGCICELTPVANPEIGTQIFLLMIIPHLGAVICYLVIGFLIRCNKTVAKETHTRLLRSLVIILCVSIGAFLLSLSVYQIILNVDFGLDSLKLWQWSFAAGSFLNVGAASHGPILYMNSVEYRNAFRNQLSRVFKSIKVVQSAVSVLQVQNSNSQKSAALQIGRRLSNVERI